jgi:hypothetical protein
MCAGKEDAMSHRNRNASDPSQPQTVDEAADYFTQHPEDSVADIFCYLFGCPPPVGPGAGPNPPPPAPYPIPPWLLDRLKSLNLRTLTAAQIADLGDQLRAQGFAQAAAKAYDAVVRHDKRLARTNPALLSSVLRNKGRALDGLSRSPEADALFDLADQILRLDPSESSTN